MPNQHTPTPRSKDVTLVLGGTGKTGRRIAANLTAKGWPVRVGSRSASLPFNWDEPDGWARSLDGVKSVYINYAPDLAIPGATDAIRSFVDLAKAKHVKRLVLLSGRGEEEAQASERIVQASGLEWTIVRASWFSQNFSEGAFTDMVKAGVIALPVGDIGEPFIDVRDIADVASAALTEDGHVGEVYEVTGPRLMTFADIAAELSVATGSDIRFVPITHDAFADGIKQSGMPDDVAWLLDYLFTTVLDGRNASLNDGVERALGRKPRDFADYAAEMAVAGIWEDAA